MRYFIILVVLLLTACAELGSTNGFGHQQKIALKLPKSTYWTKRYNEVSPNGILQRAYFPSSELPSSWTQAIFETYYPRHPSKIIQLLNQQRVTAQQMCAKVNFKVISTLKLATTFTITGKYCRKKGDSFMMGKIMQGADGLYLLQYVAITSKVSERAIQSGMNSVMAGRLID